MRPVMPFTLFSIALFILNLAGPASSAAQTSSQPADPTESLIRQSTFIFLGTVVNLNASTMSEVPANESTAVVRVDEIIEAPGTPSGLLRQEITVQLSQPGSLKAGDQATFFTRGWLLGNSMAVIEIGHAVGASVQQTGGQAQATRQKMADEALQAEIAGAESIVAGTVASVRPSHVPHIGSEHDPDWYEAELTISSVVKGHLPGHTVTVLFPHSEDPMWQGAPKFKEGQQGIWLLHRNQMSLPGIKDQYTVLNPLDFQTMENLERIRKLLKSQG